LLHGLAVPRLIEEKAHQLAGVTIGIANDWASLSRDPDLLGKIASH
jgi:hypothetical protein